MYFRIRSKNLRGDTTTRETGEKSFRKENTHTQQPRPTAKPSKQSSRAGGREARVHAGPGTDRCPQGRFRTTLRGSEGAKFSGQKNKALCSSSKTSKPHQSSICPPHCTSELFCAGRLAPSPSRGSTLFIKINREGEGSGSPGRGPLLQHVLLGQQGPLRRQSPAMTTVNPSMGFIKISLQLESTSQHNFASSCTAV